jgi:cysteine desulfurase
VVKSFICYYFVMTPRIYLDYNATTPLKPTVVQAMQNVFGITGNASSVHTEGRLARKHIENARQAIATLINAPAKELVFVSGATEANATVIQGVPCAAWLVESTSHAASIDQPHPAKHILPVQQTGLIDLRVLEAMLQSLPKPCLVSVLAVNNETGVIQPIANIAQMVHQYGGLLHVDAVQAVGKTAVDMAAWSADYMVLSAHKMGGPCGVGAWVKAPTAPEPAPLLHGGGQERRKRAGTENLLGIVGFGAAAAVALADMPAWQAQNLHRDNFVATLKQQAPRLIVLGEDAPRVGNTVQLAVPHWLAEKQLIALDLAGFAVSSGSACASGSIKPSHVIKAMGFADDVAQCAIRISSGWHTSANEWQKLAAAWLQMYQRCFADEAF